tara:strand:+ start:317 stop:433 length:117 start_codon:yes stop_codon:yes gene_type:complete
MEDQNKRRQQIIDSEKIAFIAGLVAMLTFVIYAISQNW